MSGIKHSLFHRVYPLAFIAMLAAALSSMTASAMDNRQDDLMVELGRQNIQMQQMRLSEQFDSLKAWFSSRELSQMQAEQSGLMLGALHPKQTIAIHNFLSAALSPLGYLRITNLIRLQKVQSEIQGSRQVMATHLRVQSDENTRLFHLSGPTVSLELMASGNDWMLNQMAMGQWPSQIPPAPQPDLSAPDIHYPYIRWHESTGEMTLGDTAQQVIQALNALPEDVRKRSCAGEIASGNQCMIPGVNEMKENTRVSVVNINAKGRFLLNHLLMMLKKHLGPSSEDSVKSSMGTMFSWVGDIPSSDNGMPESLLLNLSDGSGLWQILITGHKPADGFSNLPSNGVFIAFSRSGLSMVDKWEHMTAKPAMIPTAKEPPHTSMTMPPSEVNSPSMSAIPAVTLAGGTDMPDTPINNNSMNYKEGMPTWLKSPAFLNGMTVSLGYMGNNLTTALPFKPVVEVKRDGRPHRNIRVSLSIRVADKEDYWLKDFPLNFDNRTEDYRSSVRFPATMAGQEVMLEYSVHEPGTRYEGLYEYKIILRGRNLTRSL